jgi:hypothetical protein
MKTLKRILQTVAGIIAVVICLPLFFGLFVEMRRRL